MQTSSAGAGPLPVLIVLRRDADAGRAIRRLAELGVTQIDHRRLLGVVSGRVDRLVLAELEEQDFVQQVVPDEAVGLGR